MKPVQHWGSTDHLKRPRKAHSNNPIQLCRVAAGLTQSQLAAMLDVSLSTVRHWEQGTRVPSGCALVRLKRELGVNIDDLIG